MMLFFCSLVKWRPKPLTFRRSMRCAVTAGLFFLSACLNDGEKGAWSEEFKTEFQQGCIAGRQDPISEAQMTSICTCVLERIQQKYAPAELNNSNALKEGEIAGADCAALEKSKSTP